MSGQQWKDEHVIYTCGRESESGIFAITDVRTHFQPDKILPRTCVAWNIDGDCAYVLEDETKSPKKVPANRAGLIPKYVPKQKMGIENTDFFAGSFIHFARNYIKTCEPDKVLDALGYNRKICEEQGMYATSRLWAILQEIHAEFPTAYNISERFRKLGPQQTDQEPTLPSDQIEADHTSKPVQEEPDIVTTLFDRPYDTEIKAFDPHSYFLGSSSEDEEGLFKQERVFKHYLYPDAGNTTNTQPQRPIIPIVRHGPREDVVYQVIDRNKFIHDILDCSIRDVFPIVLIA
jgi:hypothetical protein